MLRNLLAAPLLLAIDAPMEIAGTTQVPATVGGVSAQLRVDPGGPSMPVFSPDFAAKAGFDAGMFGSRAMIGPVQVVGKTAVIRFDLGAGEYKRRVTWFDRPMTDGADGVVGPGGVQATRVRFTLRPAAAGDRTMTLPLADFGFVGMGVELPVGGETVRVLLMLDRARTLASASAGNVIAAAQDGHFDQPAERMIVRLGVERPVRHIALKTPLAIGPVALHGLYVRTADFGNASGISDGSAPDPDEIVVSGKTKGKRKLLLSVGADDLKGCASILFDKKAKTVTLSCR